MQCRAWSLSSQDKAISLCASIVQSFSVTMNILTYPLRLLNEHGRGLRCGEWNQRGKAGSEVAPGLWDTRDLVRRTQLGTCCDHTPPVLTNLTGKHGPVCF